MFSPNENGVVVPGPARVFPFGFARHPRFETGQPPLQFAQESLNVVPAHLLDRLRGWSLN
jgi:hypothetical protein